MVLARCARPRIPEVAISTLAFALLLIPALVLAPDVPGRVLMVGYALTLAVEFLARRSGFLSRFRLGAYPFIAAALLLTLTLPLLLGTAQSAAAERVANWAVGFLMLGVGAALLQLVPVPQRITSQTRLRGAVPALVPVFLLGIGYFLAPATTYSPERTFIVDVNPKYVADRIAPNDILVSTSPSLRLAAIPKVGAHLDLDPDRRGVELWDELAISLRDRAHVFWVTAPNDDHDRQRIFETWLEANACLEDMPHTTLPIRVYSLRQPLTRPTVLPPGLARRVDNPFAPTTVDFGAIQITGAAVNPRVCSHDAVAIALRWEQHEPSRDPLKVSLFLMDAHGKHIQSQDWYIDDPAGLHTDAWKPGAQVFGYYTLPVPFGTAPVEYSLGAAVYRASTSQRLAAASASGVLSTVGNSVILDMIHLYRPEQLESDPFNTRQEAGFLPASVELRPGLWLDGYMVAARDVIPGESLDVVAQWRAGPDGPGPYDVSVTLKQGERVIAERAGAPVDGRYPTDRWRAGERVNDRSYLEIPVGTPGGPARLEIGVQGGKSLYVADIAIASVARTFASPPVNYPVSATLGGVGDLLGFDFASTQIQAGTALPVDVFWRAGPVPMHRDWTVFVQLLGADGHLVAQSDGMPGDGTRPTRSWLPGEIIRDHHTLVFSDPAYRGPATLLVGMYDPETGVRLKLDRSGEDSVSLPGLDVTGR